MIAWVTKIRKVKKIKQTAFETSETQLSFSDNQKLAKTRSSFYFKASKIKALKIHQKVYDLLRMVGEINWVFGRHILCA